MSDEQDYHPSSRFGGDMSRNEVEMDLSKFMEMLQENASLKDRIRELEDKKKLTNELGFYSREFARLLAKMKIKEVDYKLGFKVVKFFNDELNLHIISKDVYDTQIEQIHISESNDKRIIEVASIAQEYYIRKNIRKPELETNVQTP